MDSTSKTSLPANERGATTTVEYALTLGLSGLLMISIVTGLGGVVDVQNQQTTEEQLEVLSERFVADINTADRFLRQIDPGIDSVYSSYHSYPSQVVTSGYTITVTDDNVTFETTDGTASVVREHNVDLDIAENEIRGGNLLITWDGSSIAILPEGLTQADAIAGFVVEITNVDEPILEGETLEVTASVQNTGSDTLEQDIELEIDGTVEDAETLSLEPDEDEIITLEWETDDTDGGEYYDVVARSEDDAGFDIAEVQRDGVPHFEVDIIDVNDPVTPGETVEVDVDVENAGSATDSQDVLLSVYRVGVTDETELELEEGESKTITLEWETDPDTEPDVHDGFVYTDDDQAYTPIEVEE